VETLDRLRIASLLPSATEIVCALGLADRVVGVSHECDFPPEIHGRPVLTEPKIDPGATSAEIHAGIEGLVREGLAVYRIRTETLRHVAPDLIVTQDQCEVCAVSLDDVSAAVRTVLARSVEIVSLRPTRLAHLWDDIARVAVAAGVPAAAGPLVDRLRRRLESLAGVTRRLPRRPRVAVIEWIEPLMIAGNWVPDLVHVAGGADEHLIAPGAHSGRTSWAALAAYAPEVIVIAPCGFSIAQTRRDLPRLAARPEWGALPAVRTDRVHLVDGNLYLNRPGPRLVEGAEILAHAIHPEVCARVPGGGWLHLTPAGGARAVPEAGSGPGA
jgi:iron complex transport system substrate-binding protein